MPTRDPCCRRASALGSRTARSNRSMNMAGSRGLRQRRSPAGGAIRRGAAEASETSGGGTVAISGSSPIAKTSSTARSSVLPSESSRTRCAHQERRQAAGRVLPIADRGSRQKTLAGHARRHGDTLEPPTTKDTWDPDTGWDVQPMCCVDQLNPQPISAVDIPPIRGVVSGQPRLRESCTVRRSTASRATCSSQPRPSDPRRPCRQTSP